MDCATPIPMHIPWTPRLPRKAQAAPKRDGLSSSYFELLKRVMLEALAPFVEAREALCLALLEFDRRIEAQPRE